MVKNLPTIQETPVQFQGQEDPLEKGMGTHSSSLVWRIPWTEEPGGLQSMGLDCSKESDTTEWLTLFTFKYRDAITLTAETEEELKSFLMSVKEE